MYITFFNNYFHFCCYFVFLEVSFIPAFFLHQLTPVDCFVMSLLLTIRHVTTFLFASLPYFFCFFIFNEVLKTMKYLQSVLEIWEVLTANKFTFANGHLNIDHLIWMIGLETIRYSNDRVCATSPHRICIFSRSITEAVSIKFFR